jgi:hypothetical protein
MSGPAAVQTQTAVKPTITPITGGVLQRQCACGQHTPASSECEECKQKREGTLQRAAINPSPVHEVPPIVHEVLRSPGQPLDAATRAFMEPRFGHDFSNVQLHTDAKSAESAQAVNALAYTVGRDVVFESGQYAPSTVSGKRLIAHELTHVVQQSRGLQRSQEEIGAPSKVNASEQEAVQVSQRIVEGGIAGINEATGPYLARKANSVGSDAPSANSSQQSIPRPPGIPLDGSVVLQPVTLSPALAAAIPEGKVTLIVPPAPPNLMGNYGISSEGAAGSTATAMGAATVENVSSTLTTFGFNSAPGGNAIGMIGFPGKGLGWGHTAVYIRVNGRIIITRGFMPASSLEALLNPGVKTGESSIPGRISNDSAVFMRDAAQAIEYPVTEQVALQAATDLPKAGVPPEGFAARYTARPGVRGIPGETNCVGFACNIVESRLGGKVGTEKLGAVMEPANPTTEGLQGRFMKTSSSRPDFGELNSMPKATGPGVSSGMPTSLKVLKWGGRVFLVAGGVLAIAAVVRAPEEEKAHVAAVEGGGFLAGFIVGAGAGLFCGPGAPVCSVVLGLVFGVAGSLAGREAAEVAYDEAVGDDETVREWIKSHSSDDLSRQQPGTKIQMILALMAGWISNDDVQAIAQICQSVRTSAEANVLRDTITPLIVRKMSSIGQRTQVRVSLANMPK